MIRQIQQIRTFKGDCMAIIDLVLSEDMLIQGIKSYIPLNTDTAPHLAVSGITGSGKTYLIKLLLARISKHIKNASITFCDFKGDSDFNFLNNAKNFYRFEECISGFQSFYDDFLNTQRNNSSSSFKVLVFDEWGSFLNYLDKKNADEAKKKLASLLMLARSFEYHIFLSQQRLDAESFGKARDNFNTIITLGNPSKEVREMLFSDYKEEIVPDRKRGSGYMLTNGTNFQKIVVPKIGDMELVNSYIRQAVER